jgi:hypothetical protein
MPTPTPTLEPTLKRELTVDGTAYTLTLTPDGLQLVQKGKRKGLELSWSGLVSGDAALAAELRGSLNRLG